MKLRHAGRFSKLIYWTLKIIGSEGKHGVFVWAFPSPPHPYPCYLFFAFARSFVPFACFFWKLKKSLLPKLRSVALFIPFQRIIA